MELISDQMLNDVLASVEFRTSPPIRDNALKILTWIAEANRKGCKKLPASWLKNKEGEVLNVEDMPAWEPKGWVPHQPEPCSLQGAIVRLVNMSFNLPPKEDALGQALWVLIGSLSVQVLRETAEWNAEPWGVY